MAQGVCGTLIVAGEGINGTIGGPADGIEAVLDAIRAIDGFSELEHKESWSDDEPFLRMKVRIKPEVTATAARSGLRPVAKALGWSVSIRSDVVITQV